MASAADRSDGMRSAVRPAFQEKKNSRLFRRLFSGGDKRDRTADLLNAIQALSQLSYTPNFVIHWRIWRTTGLILAERDRNVNPIFCFFLKILRCRGALQNWFAARPLHGVIWPERRALDQRRLQSAPDHPIQFLTVPASWRQRCPPWPERCPASGDPCRRPWRESGLPPPEPPAMADTCLTMSPPLRRP